MMVGQGSDWFNSNPGRSRCSDPAYEAGHLFGQSLVLLHDLKKTMEAQVLDILHSLGVNPAMGDLLVNTRPSKQLSSN